jgi:hypothetical protein
MKYVRADHAFVYYYAISPLTGESHGLRFSRVSVASIRGVNPNPEGLNVGPIYNLPVLPDEATETIYEAIGEVIDEHPEVSDLLAGRTILEQVI